MDSSRTPTPFDIVRFAHLELVVTDLGASREFYVDVLGLTVTEETDDALYLRAIEERLHHSLVLRLGPEPIVGHIGYRVWSSDDLELLAAHYAALGCEPRWVGEEVELGQGPGRALRVQDPLGFPVEFFHEMRPAERILQRYDLHRGAMLQRIEHVNLYVPEVVPAFDLYRALGFRCSEYIETKDGRLTAVWLYRKPTVHDTAFTTGFGPRMHHLAYTPVDSQAILRICDVLAGANRETAIERGPGRHGVSNAFFLYLRDPDGHRIELYTGDYYTGDPDFEPIRWSSTDPRRRNYWGHEVPDSWFDDGSRVASYDGGVVPVREPSLDERVGVLH
jgi:3,4-dihydroxyphenylacetate 2,3-dioxygenase